MRIATWGRIGLLAAATALAACGGGSGGGGAVSLKTKDDVIREIDNAALLQIIADPEAFVPAGGGGEPAGYRALSDRTNISRQVAKNYTPSATEDCPAGGTHTANGFSGNFVYSLFGQTLASEYSVEEYDGCEEEFEGDRFTLDGAVKVAGTSGTGGSSESPTLYAAVFGSGSTPFRNVIESIEFSDRITTRIRGRFEERVAGLITESRDAVDIDIAFSAEGETFSFGLDIGETDDPFVVSEDAETGALEIDGPIGYSSEFCDDGVVHYTTVQALHHNGDTGLFDAGELLIESGDSSVTVTFQEGGGATYEFANGAGGAIAAGDLGSGGGCMAL